MCVVNEMNTFCNFSLKMQDRALTSVFNRFPFSIGWIIFHFVQYLRSKSGLQILVIFAQLCRLLNMRNIFVILEESMYGPLVVSNIILSLFKQVKYNPELHITNVGHMFCCGKLSMFLLHRYFQNIELRSVYVFSTYFVFKIYADESFIKTMLLLSVITLTIYWKVRKRVKTIQEANLLPHFFLATIQELNEFNQLLLNDGVQRQFVSLF